jgi:ATP-dependent DNA helicase RecG
VGIAEDITQLKGVGDQTALLLRRLGITTIPQLLQHYPRRYDDYSTIIPIAKIHPGHVTLQARITNAKGRYVRRGMHITEAIAQDTSGSVRLVWFNQPYRARQVSPSDTYYISGEFSYRNQRLAIINPSVELESAFPINTARIIPIYRETKGLKSTQLRQLIRRALTRLQHVSDPLPQWLVNEQSLMPYFEAIRAMHFPESSNDLAAAQRRLGFQEVFELSLAALLNKQIYSQEATVPITFNQQLAQIFVAALPFSLTDSQRRAVWQIYQDMSKPHPMNRLLQGDVGAGKTVVAAMAALMALQQGLQVYVMAPTELLAQQHYQTFKAMLHTAGFAGTLVMLSGSLSKTAKQQVYTKLKEPKPLCVVGTHALLSEGVDPHNLSLVIVDEQHRFGVKQRRLLQKKAGHLPHVLHMSATPIPRSLALTLYGELSMSILCDLPAGRKPIETELHSPNSRQQMYQKLAELLGAGSQAYVVCPTIDETDTENALKLPSVQDQYRLIKQHPLLQKFRVELLHGRMSASDKAAIMQQFKDAQIDILVSTTVIEVGVDVPNASVMIIEGADRFGLAQLHQLRGRVGRSDAQGYCWAVTSDSAQPSRRLRAFAGSNDGFKLAQLDLDIRGPGAIYGHTQHGQLDLRVASLSDYDLIQTARQSANTFIKSGEQLVQYTQLAAKVKQLQSVTHVN